MDPGLILSVIAAVLAAYLTAFARQQETAPATRLTFGLICISSCLFILNRLVGGSEYIRVFIISLLFVFGPTVWWLVISQISGTRRLHHWIHWAPAALAAFILLWFPTESFTHVVLIASAHRLVYSCFAAKELWQAKTVLESRQKFMWLSTVVLILMLLSTNTILSYVLLWAMDNLLLPAKILGMANAVIITAGTATLMWWALIQPIVYQDQTHSDEPPEQDPTDFDRDTYTKLDQLFSDPSVLGDEALNLSKTADLLAVTPRELSYAINRCAQKSFRAYLRTHRIEYAKKLLSNPDWQDAPILNIAHEAGYTTKSTFNVAFKHETDVTPSEYRASASRSSTGS